TVLTTWPAAQVGIRVTNLTSTGSPSTARLPMADRAKPSPLIRVDPVCSDQHAASTILPLARCRSYRPPIPKKADRSPGGRVGFECLARGPSVGDDRHSFFSASSRNASGTEREAPKATEA